MTSRVRMMTNMMRECRVPDLRRSFRSALAAAALLCGCLGAADAVAGMSGGPLVVWINLSPDPEPVDKRIQAYLRSGEAKRDCGNFGLLIYMIRKPAGITPAMATAALINKQPTVLARLNRLLRKPFWHADDGMDGIVVYSENPGPKFYSVTTGKKEVRELEVYLKELETGFCVMLPPVIRNP